MRGTPNVRPLAGKGDGIIPAYAGNTLALPWLFRCLRDHPRVCGEHIFNAPARVELPGSSPRMRGTQFAVLLVAVIVGIIPAYAGNTRHVRA